MSVLFKKSLHLIKLFVLGFIFIIGCSDDTVEPSPPTVIQIIVKSNSDSTNIAGANVVLYNANSGESVSRTFSGNNGVAEFQNVNPGNYFVRIAAQGFNELPVGNVSPLPFSVISGQTFNRSYFLDPLAGTYGKIDGVIIPNMPGFLVIAKSTNTNTEVHTYSGQMDILHYSIFHSVPIKSTLSNPDISQAIILLSLYHQATALPTHQ